MELQNFIRNLLDLQESLLGFAYSLTLDKDEAKDLLQETSLKALNNREKFVENENLKGWLFTIMRNTFINDYRKDSRYQMIDWENENLIFQNDTQSEYGNPEEIYHFKELNDILKKLNKENRISMGMYLSGYRYEEIAQKMNIPLGTVKSRIFFTRKHLRSMLKDYK